MSKKQLFSTITVHYITINNIIIMKQYTNSFKGIHKLHKLITKIYTD